MAFLQSGFFAIFVARSPVCRVNPLNNILTLKCAERRSITVFMPGIYVTKIRGTGSFPVGAQNVNVFENLHSRAFALTLRFDRRVLTANGVRFPIFYLATISYPSR